MKKYFGCKYMTGHLRKNQNVLAGCKESDGCTYTHCKDKSANDDYDYIRAKRYFKINDIIPKYYVYHLLRNNYYVYAPLILIDLDQDKCMDYTNYVQDAYHKK